MCPSKDSLWKNEFVRPIEDILKKINVINYDVLHFLEIDEKKIEKYDKIILSGSPLGDFEYLNHLDKFNWLKDTEKTVIGICGGMQIIGKFFGAKLFDCQEIGIIKIKTIKKNKLFEKEFEAYCLHNNAIRLPENFEILAESDKCIEAIKHKEKEIYGLLFHPEVRNKFIVENFVKLR
jgi:GMP synthase (glutamine-hydrolysing)